MAEHIETTEIKDVEIFRTGTFGENGEWTRKDLKILAASYDPNFQEAPLTLDHHAHGPALGWLRNPRVVGPRLLADFTGVPVEFEEMVEAGLFKKRSIEVVRAWDERNDQHYIWAVSFLGAAIPRVKGMRDIKFEDTELGKQFAELEEYQRPHEAETMCFAFEEVEKPEITWWDNRKQAKVKIHTDTSPSKEADMSEPKKEDKVDPKAFEEQRAEMAAMKEQVAKLSEEVDSKNVLLDAHDEKFEALSAEVFATNERRRFDDAYPAKIFPALKAKALAVFQKLPRDDAGDAMTRFAEGKDMKEEPIRAVFLDLLRQRAEIIEATGLDVGLEASAKAMSERASGDRAEDSKDEVRAVEALMAEDKSVKTFAEGLGIIRSKSAREATA